MLGSICFEPISFSILCLVIAFIIFAIGFNRGHKAGRKEFCQQQLEAIIRDAGE
jgi:hypothetical protein